MVSEQKDTEFRHHDYGDLKKVYSIWLFMESPEYAAHTISSYTITHNSLYGEYVEKERYDLMNVVAVRLAVDEALEGGCELHQMLETLFASEMTVQEKEEKLEKDFGMRMTETVKEGANSMCNYSDFVEERAIKRGLERGLQQGLQQGQRDKLIELVQKKLVKNCSVEQIADALEESVVTIQEIIDELKE